MGPIPKAGLKTQSPRQQMEPGKHVSVDGRCFLSLNLISCSLLSGQSWLNGLSQLDSSDLIYNTFDKSPQAEKGSGKRYFASKSSPLNGKPLPLMNTA